MSRPSASDARRSARIQTRCVGLANRADEENLLAAGLQERVIAVGEERLRPARLSEEGGQAGEREAESFTAGAFRMSLSF